MAKLWTDVLDPAEITGYAREELELYEQQQGSLARWLPNRPVADIVARFVKGQTGLVDIADFRAFDAEPTVGKLPGGQRVTLELPALGQTIPCSEYNQLRARNANASDEAVVPTLERAAKAVARAVVDSMEHLRGIVLQTGRATVSGFMDDDFGRSSGMSVSASTVWTTSSVDALGEASDWLDTYVDANGAEPGAALMSRKVLRAIAALDQFATPLATGGNRPATLVEAQATWEAQGLPPIYLYNRRVGVGGVRTKVLSDDRIFFLPEPVDPNGGESELGATHWGQTLTASDPDYGIEDAEQPGLVVGLYRNEKPPMIAEAISDAIGLPTLANADLSMVADVI